MNRNWSEQLPGKTIPQILLCHELPYTEWQQLVSYCKLVLNEKFPSAEIISLAGVDTDAATFHAELSTMPMFEPERIIIVSHADPLLTQIAQDKTIFKKFEQDFQSIPETTFLILQLDKPDVPNAWKFIEKLAKRVGPEKVPDWQVAGKLKERAEKSGFSISMEACELIAEKVHYSWEHAIVIYDQVMLYCLEEKKIGAEDVSLVATDEQGNLFFKLLDEIALGNIENAIGIFQKHQIDNPDLLFFQWTKLFFQLAKYQLWKNLPDNLIWEQLGVNTKRQYVFKKTKERFINMDRAYPPKRIRNILHRLTGLDEKMKETGQKNEQVTICLSFLFYLTAH